MPVAKFSGKAGGAKGKVFRAVADSDETTERIRIVLSEGGGVYTAKIAEIDVFGENYIREWTAKSGAEVSNITEGSDDAELRKPESTSGNSRRKKKPLADSVQRGQGISTDCMVDLTKTMSADGKLDWEVPEGPWMIVRFGHTSRGATNRPATEGEGLESDKFRRDVTKLHFDHYLGMMAEKHRQYMGSTFVAMWEDSWETGFQNWSPVFMDEFKRRRGYDPHLYLPAMTGRMVGTGALSDRFLWDVRRTIADLSADNFIGALTELGKPYGIGLWFQPINRHFMDGLQAVGRATGAEANMFFDRRAGKKQEFARREVLRLRGARLRADRGAQ